MRRGLRLESKTEVGRWAETLVEGFLRARAYNVIARNMRLGHLECDLIVSKGQETRLCEVRSAQAKHPNFQPELNRILGPAKRSRVLRSAQCLNHNYPGQLGAVDIAFVFTDRDRLWTRIDYFWNVDL